MKSASRSRCRKGPQVSNEIHDEVARYIANQEDHHRKKGFAEEFRLFVERYGLTWHDERLDEVPHLYGAGASYVLTPRLLEASHLMEIMVAAEKDLLHEKREQHKESVTQRDEVVP